MGKIKLSLVSGSNLEKPLVTAFKGNNGEYIVLDNEMNGTMGLPIILVSKLENNKLVKIVDQNEWNAVKENLRMIIAGNQVDYVTVDENLVADDMFFSQLTLPVASFEALKNNYNPNAGPTLTNASTSVEVGSNNTLSSPVSNESVASESVVQSVPTTEPVGGATIGMVNPTLNSGTQVNTAPINNQPISATQIETPVTSEMSMSQTEVQTPNIMMQPNVMPNVNSNQTFTSNNAQNGMPEVTPVMPTPPQNSQVEASVIEPTAPIAPEMPVAPDTNNDTSSDSVPVDFTADKEAFLKACENMFDALVAKFNK